MIFTVFAWLILATLTAVDADREWIPGERRLSPSLYFDEDSSRTVKKHELEELEEWLRSREWAEKMKNAAQAAAVSSARAEGQLSSAIEYNPWSDALLRNRGENQKWPVVPNIIASSAPAYKEEENFSLENKLAAKAVAAAREGNTDKTARKQISSAAMDGENSDDDFTFAVGPEDPRFYESSSRRGGSSLETFTERIVGFDKMDIDFNGDNSRMEDDDASPLPVIQVPLHEEHGLTPLTFIAIVAACCAAGFVAIILLGVCSYKLQKKAKAAADVEYPAYGVTGPSKDVSPGSADRRLAQSAQMYHYQHQKQQIIAMERASSERRGSLSEPESEDENEEGDYTVYECPGLASTKEMEVKNPLFVDDATPASPARQQTDTFPSQPQELPK